MAQIKEPNKGEKYDKKKTTVYHFQPHKSIEYNAWQQCIEHKGFRGAESERFLWKEMQIKWQTRVDCK